MKKVLFIAAAFTMTIQVGCTQRVSLAPPGSLGSSSTNGSSAPTSTSHSVNIAWNASTSPSVNYFVYRGTQTGGPYTKLNSVAQSSLTYSDTNVKGGATYFYVTTSLDSNNNESANSNEISATVPSP